MAKMVIEDSTLKGLADALRKVTGETRTYTPTEMIEAVSTILESGTYILVDEEGNEIPAVFVENETRFDATANDIRIGKLAVTDSGVTEGTKEIPSYVTDEGLRVVPKNSAFTITHDHYDFTKLQAIICAYNTSITDSVATKKVVIEGNVYDPNSTVSLSEVMKEADNVRINFGIVNDLDSDCIIRYFMYKEVY